MQVCDKNAWGYLMSVHYVMQFLGHWLYFGFFAGHLFTVDWTEAKVSIMPSSRFLIFLHAGGATIICSPVCQVLQAAYKLAPLVLHPFLRWNICVVLTRLTRYCFKLLWEIPSHLFCYKVALLEAVTSLRSVGIVSISIQKHVDLTKIKPLFA